MPDIEALAALEPRVVGARLQGARKEARKTQDDAARFLGVARTTITAIEKGDRKVKPSELVRLAAFYGQRVSDLMRQGSLTPPLALQLRATLAPNEPLNDTLDQQAWYFQHLCEDYVQLEQICAAPLSQRYPAERVFAGIPIDDAAEELATAERLRLGLGDGPVINLRDTLEQDAGLRIFYLSLPSDVAGMFSFDEALGACIAVNAHHKEPRRRLTLAHEYAHFLTSRRTPSVDFAVRYQRLPDHERFANAFAPAFLMPATGIRRRFNEIKASSQGNFTYADLLSLSHYYGASLQGLTKRLEQLKLVQRGTWERVRESGFKSDEGKALLHLVQAPVAADLLPTRYLVLAVHGYQAGKLTEGQFAHFLRVDLLEARRVLQETLERSSNSDSQIEHDAVIDRPKLDVV